MELVSTKFAPRAKELDPVEGVGWGNRASMRLVSGPTYHDIELVTNIENPADIERVEVTLNGSQIINVSGQTLVNLQKHRKTYTEAGRYVIPFGESEYRTKLGMRQSDLVTKQGEIWFVYVTLKAAPSDSAPSMPTIRARAHVLPSQAVRYYLPKLYEITWNSAATGRTPFDFAERSQFLSLKRIHFIDSSVERVRILRDDLEEVNVRKEDNAYDLASVGQEQNAGWFSVDFTRYGLAEGVLNTAAVNKLAFELDKTEAGAVPVIVEAIEQVTALPTSA